MQSVTRASKFSRDPVMYRDEVVSIAPENLTKTDFSIIRISYEHYATPVHLAALIGCSVEWMRRRTRTLKRPPNNYLDHAPHQKAEKKKYVWAYQRFSWTPRGRDELHNVDGFLPRKFPRSSSPAHDVMADDGILSLKIGERAHPDIKVIDAHYIVSPLRPFPVAEGKDGWHRFPLVKEKTGSKWNTADPDYFPRGYVRPFDVEGEHPFIVFEFERGTNSLPRSEYRSSKIGNKLIAWVDVLTHETYWTHMGLPSLYIALICYPARVPSLLDQIRLEVPEKFWPFFVVKAMKEEKWDDDHLPTGWMLETDFTRVKSYRDDVLQTAPFNLLTSALDLT